MKKLFYVLLGVVLISMIFTTTSCKKHYDIRGTWTVSFEWNVSSPAKVMANSKVSSEKLYSNTCTITFSGDETTGTFIDCFDDTGTWSVDGDEVSWHYTYYPTTYSGTISDDSHMSGTIIYNSVNSGTWSATR